MLGPERGAWQLEPIGAGFRLTIRSRIGVEAFILAIVALVAVGLLVLIGWIAWQSLVIGTFDVYAVITLAVFFLISIAILTSSGSGLAWLIAGCTVVEYDGTDFRVSFPGHLFARPHKVERVNLESLHVWKMWLLAGYLTRRVILGGVQGPLVCESWDGFALSFGGDISLATAKEIVGAVGVSRAA